jgi:phosphoglycerate dehydrogenase-like enzyme
LPVVLITPALYQDPSRPYAVKLRQAGFEVRYPSDPAVTTGATGPDAVVAEWSVADAVIAGGEHCTAEVLGRLPRLRVIARAGVGYDRIDVDAATRRNVLLTITPTANHECVAEHALALLFAAARSIARYDRAVRAGGWPRSVLVPLRGRTLGIVGLGRIGRSLAKRAEALGMKVLAADERPDRDFARAHGIELTDLDSLLARADFVSIHCPLSPATRGMFGAREFAKMKPGAIFINTARGGLVVESDLAQALASGHLAAAGLDVLSEEPPPPDHPLLRADNVVLSPHLGGADETSVENMGRECADAIIRHHRGEWPDGAVVNDSLRGAWKW